MTARDAIADLQQRMGTSIIGQRDLIRQMLIGLLANGHLLLESLPGLAKTRAVKSLAKNLDARMRRIQFTPDLLPSDVTGTTVFEPQTGSFTYRPGPIFAHVVLADEINRTSPKVQSAMLEAMAEKQVTVDNKTRPLDELFFVIATQNPLDLAGTYPLPVAQLDRFLFKVRMVHIDRESEIDVLRSMRERKAGAGRAMPKVRRSEINNFQGRYMILHPWEGAMSCESPQRGVWGARDQGAQAATNLASVSSGAPLASYLAVDLPELDVVAAPADNVRFDGTGRRIHGGCASCAAAPSATASAWIVVAIVSVCLRYRTRRNRPRSRTRASRDRATRDRSGAGGSPHPRAGCARSSRRRCRCSRTSAPARRASAAPTRSRECAPSSGTGAPWRSPGLPGSKRGRVPGTNRGGTGPGSPRPAHGIASRALLAWGFRRVRRSWPTPSSMASPPDPCGSELLSSAWIAS